MKKKGFTGIKKCNGEVYMFKNGKAKVPGVWFGAFKHYLRNTPHTQAYISFREFVELNQ